MIELPWCPARAYITASVQPLGMCDNIASTIGRTACSTMTRSPLSTFAGIMAATTDNAAAALHERLARVVTVQRPAARAEMPQPFSSGPHELPFAGSEP